MANKPKKTEEKDRPGPKPEIVLPFNGTFEDAVDLALSKKRPAKGWPNPTPRKSK
jgi:hypothetical protein